MQITHLRSQLSKILETGLQESIRPFKGYRSGSQKQHLMFSLWQLRQLELKAHSLLQTSLPNIPSYVHVQFAQTVDDVMRGGQACHGITHPHIVHKNMHLQCPLLT